jgi:hypothetical protein
MVMSCFLAALGHEQPCGSLLSQSIQLEYDWPDENRALIPVSFREIWQGVECPRLLNLKI